MNISTISISSSTLQFLLSGYQNGVNCHYLIVKSIEVTSVFISKGMKKVARWRHHWNIWHLTIKTKISPLVVCYQGLQCCVEVAQQIKLSGCPTKDYFTTKSDKNAFLAVKWLFVGWSDNFIFMPMLSIYLLFQNDKLDIGWAGKWHFFGFWLLGFPESFFGPFQ